MHEVSSVLTCMLPPKSQKFDTVFDVAQRRHNVDVKLCTKFTHSTAAELTSAGTEAKSCVLQRWYFLWFLVLVNLGQ